MERTMQECRRVSGAFDCAYPASNGGIKDYGSRSSEVSYQKTDFEIRWLRGSHSPDGNRDRNESSRIKRMDCGMSLQVELFLLQDSWNNHSSNGLPIHGVFTN